MNRKILTYETPEIEVLFLVSENAMLAASGLGSGTEDLDLDFVDDLNW